MYEEGDKEREKVQMNNKVKVMRPGLRGSYREGGWPA